METRGVLIESIMAMSPTSFENLVYDLASSAGLRNAVWRTPGSDEGRDIEGEITTIDFSGYYATTKWYLECKRYSTSVDWPTVWQKLAYADSHGADYLLIVTTAHLSPQCKTEISRWHADRRRPAIRVWDAANLDLKSARKRHSIPCEPHQLWLPRPQWPARACRNSSL